MYSSQVRDHARLAAEYIRSNGWLSGKLRDKTGKVCAKGAAEAVCVVECEGLGNITRGLIALSDAFKEETGGLTMVQYNDHKDRTKEDIIDIFERIWHKTN